MFFFLFWFLYYCACWGPITLGKKINGRVGAGGGEPHCMCTYTLRASGFGHFFLSVDTKYVERVLRYKHIAHATNMLADCKKKMYPIAMVAIEWPKFPRMHWSNAHAAVCYVRRKVARCTMQPKWFRTPCRACVSVCVRHFQKLLMTTILSHLVSITFTSAIQQRRTPL